MSDALSTEGSAGFETSATDSPYISEAKNAFPPERVTSSGDPTPGVNPISSGDVDGSVVVVVVVGRIDVVVVVGLIELVVVVGLIELVVVVGLIDVVEVDFTITCIDWDSAYLLFLSNARTL